jgi:hypothetical protein
MPLNSHSSATKQPSVLGYDAIPCASPLKVKTVGPFKMLPTTHTIVLHPTGMQSSIQHLGLFISRKFT